MQTLNRISGLHNLNSDTIAWMLSQKLMEKNSTKEKDDFNWSIQGSSTSQYNNNLEVINKKLLQ